ncbi:MAG TPA: hotdog fold thioesterase [Sphingobacteriaceae bacterium]|nr:hotdog fold thioesterase [Sphingobacteriaceae bacterium]
MLWKQKPTIEQLNSRFDNNIGKFIGIEFVEITDDSLSAIMPVDERTKQPYGILHGGASVVLAETLGSIASNLIIDSESFVGVGLEVNANHLRPVSSGHVKGVCTPIHIGRTTHVWDIRIYEKHGKLNCISRLTVAIIPKQNNK